MRIELMPGMTNVVRFPVERRARPSLDLLRDIAPDCREVSLAVESFELELDEPLFEIRDNADRETAEYILNNVRPEPGAERRAELDGILEPLVTAAVRACREAHDAAVVSTDAQMRLVKAETDGGYWMQPLEERAERCSANAVLLMVAAYVAKEKAEGAARSVRLAKCGEEWKPIDYHAEADALFGLTPAAGG